MVTRRDFMKVAAGAYVASAFRRNLDAAGSMQFGYAAITWGNKVSDASLAYSHASSLFDVTSGSNGSCGGTELCTAAPGYDGPTGLGTPNGTGAF